MSLREVSGTRLVVVDGDPGIPPGQSSDPFAGLAAPMRLALEEGKAIGTAMLKANVGERDLSMRYLPRQQVKDALQRASQNAPAALQQVYANHRGALLGVVNGMTARRLTRDEARVRSAKLIREAYERVREIARRASAVDRLAHEGHIYAEEEKWFRSAVREEVGYFHAFLEDVRHGRAQNATERVEAYVKALRFMYEAARVQAMPDNVLLYWTGPRQAQDEHVCDGCEYLMERSPFTKDTLPAVPRDGMTQCLTNCRHRILVRVARDLNEVVRRRAVVGRRESMIRRLNEMKAAAGLGRATPKTTGAARDPFRGTSPTRRTAERIPTRRRVP
jgi:hypothetical protein